MKTTKLSTLLHIFLLSFSFLVVTKSNSQVEMNPTNHAYIKYYKDDVYKGVKELGYKSYYQQLIDEATLTPQNVLTKESYFKQLTLLAIMLQLDEGTFESKKNLLKDSYEMYEEKMLEEQKDKLNPSKSYAFTYEDESSKQLFFVLDVVPTFDECKELVDNKSRKLCLIEGVNRNIQQKLPSKEMIRIIRKEKLFEKGEDGLRYYKMKVKFEISKEGKVITAEGNSTNDKLNSFAEKILLDLPQLQPGMYNDEPKSSIHIVPIKLKESF